MAASRPKIHAPRAHTREGPPNLTLRLGHNRLSSTRSLRGLPRPHLRCVMAFQAAPSARLAAPVIVGPKPDLAERMPSLQAAITTHPTRRRHVEIRVVLGGNQGIVRDALRCLLSQEADIEIVGTTKDGKACVQLAKKLRPDVVLLGAAMPGLNGVDATRAITREVPGARVIGLSSDHDRRTAIRMLQAGAAGYLLTDCGVEEVIEATRAVAAGQTFLSSEVVSWVAQDYYARGSSAADSSLDSVTPREREVLQLVAEGKTTRDIASLLYISVKTVETFRSHLMRKLNLRGVAQLTKYAIAEGLTTLEI